MFKSSSGDSVERMITSTSLLWELWLIVDTEELDLTVYTVEKFQVLLVCFLHCVGRMGCNMAILEVLGDQVLSELCPLFQRRLGNYFMQYTDH